MKKRTAVFGVPMYVVRRQVLPLVLMFSVSAVLFGLISEVVTESVTDWLILDPSRSLWVTVCVFVLCCLPLVMSWWVFFQISRYTKRMKRLKGRACFVCNYEIAEGLDRCSECGAVWSLDDLNRYWRRNVSGG